MKFADRLDTLQSSAIREMFDKGRQNPNVVDLSIGQADYDMPAPIKDEARRVLDSVCGRYSPTEGRPDLVARAHRYLVETVGLPESEEVMITGGTTGAIMLSMLAFAGPGDEVLLPDPYFVLYPNIARVAGAKPTYYSLFPDFRLRAEAVEAAITDRTRLVVVNNPSNPTGAVFERDELAAVAEVCAARDIPIMSDEVYDHFSYDRPHTSIKAFPNVTSVLVAGPSKSHAMAGWRLGWAAAPSVVIDKMRTLQQFTYTCPPTFAQRAAMALFDTSPQPTVDRFRGKRELVVRRLREAGYSLVAPQGAFYVFPRIPWGTDVEFCNAAAEAGLLIVPGRAFSSSKEHFRISYSASEERLGRGLDILARLAKARPSGS